MSKRPPKGKRKGKGSGPDKARLLTFNRKSGPKGGRPKVAPNLEGVRRLSRYKCTDDEMAAVMGVSADTMRRWPGFAEAKEKGQGEGAQSLRAKQYALAMQGDKTMLVWLGKQMLLQRDIPVRVEATGPDGTPIPMSPNTVTLVLGQRPEGK